MAMHSENGVRLHNRKCKGKITERRNDKPGLGGFMIATCDSCPYVGRGEQVATAEELKAQSVAAELE